MTIRKVIIVIFLIAFGINLYFLITNVYSDSLLGNRDNLRPREGISIGHDEDISIEEIEYYIINTRSTDSITIRYNAVFLDLESEGKVGIYFPYKLKIISDSDDWEKKDFELGTAFLKKYSCNEEEYCNVDYFEEYEFELIPENSKFDSKNGYKHGLKIKIDHVVPYEVDRFFREYNMTHNFPLIMQYDESVKRQITIIIPENADSIHPMPIPEPDIFHNRGNDYSNTQLDWHILKKSQAFFVDYEMPDVRENSNKTQINISLTGIIMGVIVGLFGIALAIESTKKKSTLRDVDYG